MDLEKDMEKVYKLLIQIPLYKQRNKEEIFLGIKKSRFPKWSGWQYITQLKRDQKFPSGVIASGLYELAVNFWVLYMSKNQLTINFLESEYEF